MSHPVTYDLFVGRLPQSVNEAVLQRQFGVFGKISSITILPSNRPDGSRLSYIRYMTEEACNHALEGGANIVIDGSKLQVNLGKRKNKDGYKVNGDAACGAGIDMRGGDQPASCGVKNASTNRSETSSSTASSSSSSVNTTITHLALPFSTLLPCDEVALIPTEIVTPCLFWAQLANDSSAETYRQLSEALAFQCPGAPCPIGKPTLNKIYCTQYSEDQLWYRCMPISIVSATQFEVLYIDFGNRDTVSCNSIVVLSPELSAIEPLAAKYWLYALKPTQDKQLYQQGMEKMVTLKDLQVRAQIYPKIMDTDGAIPIRLLVNQDVDVNKQLTNLGIAVVMTNNELWQKVPCNNIGAGAERGDAGGNLMTANFHQQNQAHASQLQQQLNDLPPKFQRLKQQPTMNEQQLASDQQPAAGSEAQKHQQSALQSLLSLNKSPSQQQQLQIPSQLCGQAAPKNLPMSAQTSRQPIGVQDVESKARMELEKFRKEVKYLREENDALRAREDMNRVEYAGRLQAITQKCAELESECEFLKTRDADKQIRDVDAKACQLAHIRIQFPTNPDTTDVIQDSSVLLADEFKLHAILHELDVNRITHTLEEYNSAQDAIRKALVCAKETGEEEIALSDLVVARDKQRVEVHGLLEKFLSATAQLPVAAKRNSIDTMLKALKETYQGFLPSAYGQDKEYYQTDNNMKVVEDAEQAVERYRNWKNAKLTEFKGARELTDHRRAQVSRALAQLYQAFKEMKRSEDVRELPDLVAVLYSYEAAIDEELAKTNQDQSLDSDFLRKTVCTIERQLSSALAQIKAFEQLQANYRRHLEEISPWLCARPDVSKLRTVVKNIKGLKSKLRHLLADKQDLEEACTDGNAASTNDLNKLNENLCSVRYQLHVEFAREEQLLGELSNWTVNHFPELIYQLPEFSINNSIKYDNLVKLGRSLDQYTLSVISDATDNGKKDVYKTDVCGNPAVLKEYIVDAALSVIEKLIGRVLAYNEAACNNICLSLVKVQSLFIDQSKRHCILQFPFYEMTFAQYISSLVQVNERNLTPVMCGVADGLKALHDRGLIHGTIHPNNVFIDKVTGRGVIADYDFAKTPAQRLESVYVAANGLRFRSPDAEPRSSQIQVSFASDLYNVGLLWLWAVDKDGSLMNSMGHVSSCSLSSALPDIVRRLLEPLPQARPSAAELFSALLEIQSRSLEEPKHTVSSPSADDYDIIVSADDNYHTALTGVAGEQSSVIVDDVRDEEAGCEVADEVGSVGDVLVGDGEQCGDSCEVLETRVDCKSNESTDMIFIADDTNPSNEPAASVIIELNTDDIVKSTTDHMLSSLAECLQLSIPNPDIKDGPPLAEGASLAGSSESATLDWKLVPPQVSPAFDEVSFEEKEEQ